MATFYNQATLSYNGNVLNSNVTVGELVEVISASKTAVMDDYVANDDVTYVISIVNSGTIPYKGLVLTDNLGAYPFGFDFLVPLTYVKGSVMYYENGVLQPAPTVVAGPPLVISGINVPAHGNATIIYEVNVNQFAPLGVNDFIENEVQITGGGLSSPIIATETIHTQDDPVLTISKAICPAVVIENGQVTYTFTIQNTGNTAATAADLVTVKDTFSPILNPISVTFNGVSWSNPANYTYNIGNGEFSTIPGQVTVPPASYSQDPVNGNWIITPGVSILTVTGTI